MCATRRERPTTCGAVRGGVPAARESRCLLPNQRSLVSHQQSRRREPSGWANGAIIFAAALLLLIGSFQIVAGLVAIFDDNFYVVTRNYTFDLDTTAWGWIHLLVGILLVVTAMGLGSGKTWARVAAIVLAIVSAIENFFFIPYYPFWSIVVIAFDAWVIWALTRPDAMDALRRGQ
jgi:hypothetical protein